MHSDPDLNGRPGEQRDAASQVGGRLRAISGELTAPFGWAEFQRRARLRAVSDSSLNVNVA